MGQDQRDLDIPILLEVRHLLDQTAKDPPPQLLGAAEWCRTESGARLSESGHGGQEALLVGLSVHPAEFVTDATLVLG